MKRYYLIIFTILCAYSTSSTYERFQVIVEPKWEELDADKTVYCRFGGKWVLTGSIIFKKKANEPVTLDKLILLWQGEKIENLAGSLYLKEYTERFLPINDYLVSDSTWNRAQQKLLLKFNEEYTLKPTNVFYLVLTIPDNLEQTIRNGYFTIERDFLPEQYKEASKAQKLSFRIGEKHLIASSKSIKNPARPTTNFNR